MLNQTRYFGFGRILFPWSPLEPRGGITASHKLVGGIECKTNFMIVKLDPLTN